MKWRLKARLQNAIAALPFGSSMVYYAIQRTAGGLRRGLNKPLDRFAAAIRIVKCVESTGADISGKRFVEVGTGHLLNLPTALWLLGAGETITVDLHRYLSPAIVRESNDYIRRHQEEVLRLFGPRGMDTLFQKRFQSLLSFHGGIDDLLAMMNVRYDAPADATALRVEASSVDFHVSNTVLEHIPPSVLAGILREARRVLRPAGLLAHRIDPSDHFSHGDDSITAVNFLRFSPGEWRRLAGNRFMYQNRLRAPAYVKLFENAGARIMRYEQNVDQRSLDALRTGFPVAREFAGVDPGDAAVTDVLIVAGFDRTG